MYKIKQLAEDFLVEEIATLKTDEKGRYSYFILEKTNCTTVNAIEALAQKINVPIKNIGFAGNKDKNAITRQYISIFHGSKSTENILLKNISLKYIGNGNNPISLGDLEKNKFTITIRNISKTEIDRLKFFENKNSDIPNLFGPQRFSKNNAEVGKSIIKKDFKKAAGLILENDGIVEKTLKNYLSINKNDYIGALRIIPLKTRKIYVHAYQSYLFNEIAKKYLDPKNKKQKMKIPIIGFDFEIEKIEGKKLKNIIEKAIEEEKISARDFIISQMPELTSEGKERDLFFELNDLRVIEVSDDELNEEMKKTKVEFTLPKSCYATVAIKFIFS